MVKVGNFMLVYFTKGKTFFKIKGREKRKEVVVSSKGN